MKPTFIRLDTCSSTNSELAAIADSMPAGTVVSCREQSAGRGQRGNSWEAEPGRNLTFSILLRTQLIDASRQFELSMIVSLAIVRSLDSILAQSGCKERCTVKWPNDIYIGDRKVCGILIENALSGLSIDRSIAGIGINVNQLVFRSDAPNPVSLIHLTGIEISVGEMLETVAESIMEDLAAYESAPCPAGLSKSYRSRLWRGDGLPHPFTDAATGSRFDAVISDVAADGVITLRPTDGSPERRFFFKEVIFNISDL